MSTLNLPPSREVEEETWRRYHDGLRRRFRWNLDLDILGIIVVLVATVTLIVLAMPR